ncbi:MAG: D-2-hydroxyacid dehydrogenase [Paracoccaceae bacterium]
MDPVILYLEEAERVAADLAQRFPGERFLPVSSHAGLAAALGENPGVAFSVKSPATPGPGHARIAAHPGLAFFQVGGSGFEHLGDWDRDRLRVANCAGVLAPFLAETCLGAILALNHGLIRYRDQQRARLWREHWFRPLMGQTLLIVGAGAIGGELSVRAAAMGVRVIALRRSGAPVPGAAETRPPEALAESLAEADIVSLHLRLTRETEGLFDAALFARMKPGSLFVNTARGGHVIEADLLDAVRSGHLAGAYLDVFETEPLPAQSPLWDEPQILITPHASDGVTDWLDRFVAVFAENLAAWRAGRALINPVD